jgi:hypothetical protein
LERFLITLDKNVISILKNKKLSDLRENIIKNKTWNYMDSKIVEIYEEQ